MTQSSEFHADPYAHFDPRVFQRRAARFARLDITGMAPGDVFNALMFVIATGATSRSEFRAALPTSTYTYPPGTKFWRARAIATDDHFVPLRGISSVADLWEPPSDVVHTAGRLNKKRESLLYTCVHNPLAAPEEIKVAKEARFCLIKYEATASVALTGIGLPFEPTQHQTAFIEHARLIHDFLGRQFKRKATARGAYTLAEAVAKDYYDLPPEIQDGWLYESIAEPGALNATFRPDKAHGKLRLIGAVIGERSRTIAGSEFSGLCFTDASGVDGILDWYARGSDLQRSLFPEFSTRSVQREESPLHR